MRDMLQHTIPYTPSESNHDNDVEMLCAADHPAQPVEWLWPNRIPIGKVTLLVGDPGLEGLQDGRAGLIMKIHHAITDGVGGVALMLATFDLERSPADHASDDVSDSGR